MKGKAIVKNVGCCELHISILKDKDGYPADIVISPKGGGCRTNLHAIQELCSNMFELDMHDLVIKSLSGHTCVSCQSKRSKTDKEKIKVDKSCAHAIAKAIEEAMPDKPKEVKCSPLKTLKPNATCLTKKQAVHISGLTKIGQVWGRVTQAISGAVSTGQAVIKPSK